MTDKIDTLVEALTASSSQELANEVVGILGTARPALVAWHMTFGEKEFSLRMVTDRAYVLYQRTVDGLMSADTFPLDRIRRLLVHDRPEGPMTVTVEVDAGRTLLTGAMQPDEVPAQGDVPPRPFQRVEVGLTAANDVIVEPDGRRKSELSEFATLLRAIL